MTHRIDRVNHFIQQEVSDIILHRLKDPRVGLATVTRVDTSQDLKNARVYVSFYGNNSVREKGIKCLEHASGFIRTELSKAMQLRSVPQLTFVLDTTAEYSIRISKLIEEVKAKEG